MQFLILALVPIAALVILLVLIAKSSNHTSRIGNLEWHLSRLQALERQVNELSAVVRELSEQLAELTAPASRKKDSVRSKISEAKPEPIATAPPTTLQPPVTLPPKPVADRTPSRTREEWEALIGGKLFNRIGALALIIGIGYFLKYAFDNNWISETIRVLIGAVIGLVCIGGGYRTNKKGFQVFAQGLVGAGIAILYLSVYAAFNFYHLLPQWVAFVFMSVVTIIAFLNGLYYDSLAEAIIGWAGGFLTPILLSTGQSNEVGLFSYIVLLDAGLLAMTVRKERWWILEPLTFLGTWSMYVAWNNQYYADADLGTTVLFVTLFWLLFLVSDFLLSNNANRGKTLYQIIPSLNALAYFLAAYDLIDTNHHNWMGLTTLFIGAAYFLVYLVKRRTGSLGPGVGMRLSLTTLALVVFATSIQFSDFDTVMAWSIEAAVLIWLSRHDQATVLDIAAIFLFGLALFKLLFLTQGALAYFPIAGYTLLINHRVLCFAVVSAALGLSGFTVDALPGKRNQVNSVILHAAWCGTVFLLVTAEIYDYFRFHSLNRPSGMVQQMEFFRILSFAACWTILSIPLMWVGLKRKLISPAIASLAVVLLAVLFGVVRGVAFDPIEYYRPFFNVRVIVLLLIGTGLQLQTQLIRRSMEAFEWLKDVVKLLQTGILIVILILLTGETRDYFQRAIAELSHRADENSGAITHLQNMQQLMLSGVWLVYSVGLMTVGIWRKYRGLRFGAFALFGITILKIFLYDLSFLETLYRLFSFIALGLILLGVSWAYQRYKEVIFGKTV